MKLKLPVFIMFLLIVLSSCAAMPVQSDSASALTTYVEFGPHETRPFKMRIFDRYDGEINPLSLAEWDIVDFAPCPSGYPHFHFLLTNGERAIEAMMRPVSEDAVLLIGYTYTINNIRYIYGLTKKYPEKYTLLNGEKV